MAYRPIVLAEGNPKESHSFPSKGPSWKTLSRRLSLPRAVESTRACPNCATVVNDCIITTLTSITIFTMTLITITILIITTITMSIFTLLLLAAKELLERSSGSFFFLSVHPPSPVRALLLHRNLPTLKSKLPTQLQALTEMIAEPKPCI